MNLDINNRNYQVKSRNTESGLQVSIGHYDRGGMILPIGDLVTVRNLINRFLEEYSQELMKEEIDDSRSGV